MLRLLMFGAVMASTGCIIVFDPDHKHPPSSDPDPDAAIPPPDAACTAPPGLTAQIASPADGATNVSSPVEIRWKFSDPSQDARKFISIVDEFGRHPDAAPTCPTPTGPYNISCYTLQPGTSYTFSMSWICYSEPDPLRPLAHVTFRAAP